MHVDVSWKKKKKRGGIVIGFNNRNLKLIFGILCNPSMEISVWITPYMHDKEIYDNISGKHNGPAGP